LRQDVGIKPLPSLSYNLKASFSSFSTAKEKKEKDFRPMSVRRPGNANQSLTSFLVLLNDELGGENDELLELQAAGFVLVNLLNHLVEDLSVEGLTHQAEDLSDGLGGDGAALLAIE
jgi:hypothetical protein